MDFYKKYLNNENIPKGKQLFAIMCASAVFGGMFGMAYETLFYILNDGVLCRRGTSFGPWIEIYGIGALVIYFSTKGLKKKPWAVFLLSGLGAGILEYVAGAAIYAIFKDPETGLGRRGWNYNTEILSWGGQYTNGFVCLRSVLIFAFSGIFFMYIVVPAFIKLSEIMNKKVFAAIFVSLAMLFLADVVYNDIVVSVFDTYSAGDFYKEWGKNTGFYKKYNEDWL